MEKFMRKGNLLIPALITIINIALIIIIIFANTAQDSEAGGQGAVDDHQAEPVYIVVGFSPDDFRVEELQIEAPVSGFEALEKTGLEISVHDFGDGFLAVCAIEGIGCPSDDCFCAKDTYWNYHYWDGTEWMDYQVGATETQIEGAAVEGWRWGEFESYELPPADEILPHE